MLLGCGKDEKIALLKKRNQDLQAEIKKNDAAVEYDLQAKCSRDAKAWFNDNWSRDKDTLLLDYTKHYNKSQNKCFVLVEYHYSFASLGQSSSWVNDMGLWDVYENSKYGDISVTHYDYLKPDNKSEEKAGHCNVLDKKCSSIQEFNGLIQPYLND